MCGICGFVGNQDRHLLEQMMNLIIHRGPDEEGIYWDGLVALGMRRLSIIDLAHGSQPMFNEDGQIVIIFNGEIYNYPKLRQALIDKGHQFKTYSDTETVIHAYEEYGVGCLHHIEGMFAFALWDKNKQQLFIARDRLGIKPLFYMETPDGIVFGSEMRCLLQHPYAVPQVNPRTLYRYFTFGFTTDHETVFASLYQLTPGDYLLYSPSKKIQIHSYWRPVLEPAVRRLSLEAATEELSHHLCQSVKDHLVSDVPVGITLSGGLDSSSVLSQMVKHYEGQVDAFTVGYGRADDEFPFANLAARHFNVTHHRRTLSFEQTTRNLVRMIYHLEEPLPHVVASTTYELGRLVREHAKVTLIGEGGDELLAGYVQYRTMSRYFKMLPLLVRKRMFLLGYLAAPQYQVEKLFTNTFRQKLGDFHPVRDEYLPHYRHFPDGMTGAQYFEIRNELPNSQLSRIDRLTMAHSVEARVPFLDHNLVNFCFSLPPSYKLNYMVEKYILRRAMQKELPFELVNRRKGGKKGTQAITYPWYKEQLHKLVPYYLSKKHVEQREIFRPEAVQNLLNNISSKNGVMRRIALKQAYTCLLIELWFQLFIEKNPLETVEEQLFGFMAIS